MPELGEIKVVLRYKFIWHICVDCGKGRWVKLLKGSPRSIRCYSCGRKLAAKKWQEKLVVKNWEGGRSKESNGCLSIHLYPESFFYPMANKSGRVLEHRLVMAKYMKRCLLPWEVVHHKNGIPNDNRIENLELITDKRFHLVDSVVKGHIVRLNKRIEKLEMQVKLLQWRLNESEKINIQEVL